MNRRDLLELKERIYSLGETISEKEGFHRDVNEFLRQVYPTLPNAAPRRSARPSFQTISKNHWTAPSAGEQANRASVLNA